jgi:hypothetical protein
MWIDIVWDVDVVIGGMEDRMEKNEDGFVERKIEVRKGRGKWFQVRVKGKDGEMKFFIMEEVKELIEV